MGPARRAAGPSRETLHETRRTRRRRAPSVARPRPPRGRGGQGGPHHPSAGHDLHARDPDGAEQADREARRSRRARRRQGQLGYLHERRRVGRGARVGQRRFRHQRGDEPPAGLGPHQGRGEGPRRLGRCADVARHPQSRREDARRLLAEGSDCRPDGEDLDASRAPADRSRAPTRGRRAQQARGAVLSPNNEVNSHFSLPPYQQMELKDPRVHTVLNSYDVVGGPLTNAVMFGRRAFVDANPKTAEAILAALEEADKLIKDDPKKAAEQYLAATREKLTVDELVEMMKQPGVVFETTPHGAMLQAEHLAKVGVLKTRPKDWKEFFFPAIHGNQGS